MEQFMKTFLSGIESKVLCIPLLLLAISLSSYNTSFVKQLPDEPGSNITGDSIIIYKNNFSRAHKIALYTDESQTVVFFKVKGSHGSVYHLYVFDLEGRLIKQTETRNKQTTLIKNMEKGIYLFEVFNDDDKIGNGQIAIM